jgi:hypothetical protein
MYYIILYVIFPVPLLNFGRLVIFVVNELFFQRGQYKPINQFPGNT